MNVEFRKARGRHTGLLILALLGIDLACLYWSMKRTEAAALSSAWERTLFSVTLVNTLFLPVAMAILSSRTMELEHRGGTWNLLQTMQSRRSIFLGKSLYGLVWLLLFGALQGVSLVAMGKGMGFVGEVPLCRILALVLGEIASGMAVYQIGCLLSLVFSSQFAALSVNLGGTLAGLFLSLVTDRPVTPWSLLGALRVVNMHYQKGDESPAFEWFSAPASSWIAALLYLAAALILGLCLYTRLEEGTLSMFHSDGIRSAGVRTALPVELIKLKRAPVWIPFLTLPILSAAIGTLNFMMNQDVLSFTWESLWTQHALFLGLFFLPPLIGILCGLLWRMEHMGTNWNLARTLESTWKLVRDKLLVASGMSILCISWIGILYVICGLGVGLRSAPPAAFYMCLMCGAVACAAISAAQLFLSLMIRSFAVPIGMALMGGATGIRLVVKGWTFASPCAMLQTGLKSTNLERETNIGGFIAAAILYIILFYALSVLYLKRSDARTYG